MEFKNLIVVAIIISIIALADVGKEYINRHKIDDTSQCMSCHHQRGVPNEVP